jgi:hypothetical protein
VRKILSMIMMFTLSVSLYMFGNSAVYAESKKVQLFKDVDSSFWGYEAIDYMIKQGAINGYPDGTFRPNGKLKRIHVAKMLDRLLSFSIIYDEEQLNGVNLKDVPKDLDGYKSVAALYMTGDADILFTDDRFDPYRNVTREEIAYILANLYSLEATKSYEVKDVSKNNPFYPAVTALIENGVTKLYADGSFKPKSDLTRAQFAMFLSRMMNPYFNENNRDIQGDSIFYWGNYLHLTKVNYETNEEFYMTYDGVLGNVYEHGDWIYYLFPVEIPAEKLNDYDSMERGRLYRVKKDGSKKELVSTELFTAMALVDDKIYFAKYGDLNSQGGFDYSDPYIGVMNVDGTGKKTLHKGELAERMIAHNGWIYYSAYNFHTWELPLKRFNIKNQQAPQLLLDRIGQVDGFTVLENGIYYQLSTDSDEDKQVHFMNWDATNQQKLDYQNLPIAYMNGYVFVEEVDEFYNVKLFKQKWGTNEPKELVAELGYADYIGSQNGKALYYNKENSSYMAVSVE